MTIRRRELLTWAGLAAGGLLGAGCAGTSTGERSSLPAKLEGKDFQELLQQVEFTFLASPSGSVDVVARREGLLGSFGTTALDEALRQQEGGLVAEQGSPQQELAHSRVLSTLPEPLKPLTHHPLRNFHSLETGYTVDLLVVPRTETGQELRTGRSIQKVAMTWDAKFKIDEYFIRISIEKHYLGACIKRNAWHVGALVHHLPASTRAPRSNNLAFDLHIASWWEQRRPCFAIYESKSRFCRNVCRHPTWDAVVVAIYAALAAGIVAWLAWAIASAIAAAVVGGLILIPGVPPPP